MRRDSGGPLVGGLFGGFFGGMEGLECHPQELASVRISRKARQKGFLLFIGERTSQQTGDVVFVQLGMFDRARHGIRLYCCP